MLLKIIFNYRIHDTNSKNFFTAAWAALEIK